MQPQFTQVMDIKLPHLLSAIQMRAAAAGDSLSLAVALKMNDVKVRLRQLICILRRRCARQLTIYRKKRVQHVCNGYFVV